MSKCLKDIFDYDLFKRYSQCGIVSTKSNSHKQKLSKYGSNLFCISCRKSYDENQVKTNKKILREP